MLPISASLIAISFFRHALAKGSSELSLSVCFQENLPDFFKQRIWNYFQESAGDSSLKIGYLPSSFWLSKSSVLQIKIGACSTLDRLIHPKMDADESYEITAQTYQFGYFHQKILQVRGSKSTNIRSLMYATYDLLESLGFGFFHFQKPIIPNRDAFFSRAERLVKTVHSKKSHRMYQHAYWKIRRWHIHTQHPLELTHYLNGVDVRNATHLIESWDSMASEWENMLEWLIANKQNSVEWILLWTEDIMKQDSSVKRLLRLKYIVSRCNEWQVSCGVDVPIAFKQQHSLIFIRDIITGSTKLPLENMESNIVWLMSAGFDFISTEIGSSEFTKGSSCKTMLQWLNYLAEILNKQYKTRVWVKIHVSQEQKCSDIHSADGKPLNFNFLPSIAHPNVGLMIHTVQLPSMNQKSGSYGCDNFKFMFDFMFEEKNRNRSKLWYPETSYWVNYDIDVPLFLPAYGMTRLRDMRNIMREELKLSSKIDGQIMFESGWEWGYWLGNVIAARVAWDPMPDISQDYDVLFEYLKHISEILSEGSDIALFLKDYIAIQEDIFIDGLSNDGEENRISGMAYLVGRDTWSTLTSLVKRSLATLPRKVSLTAVKWSKYFPWIFKNHDGLLKLFQYMKEFTRSSRNAFNNIINKIQYYEYQQELSNCLEITDIRVNQVDHLYRAAFERFRNSSEFKLQLQLAEKLTWNALKVGKLRSFFYRSSKNRISTWLPQNPTAYSYGYLWSPTNAYFFFRDFSVVEAHSFSSAYSPCWMNIINPLDIVLGNGTTTKNVRKIVNWFNGYFSFVLACFGVPDL